MSEGSEHNTTAPLSPEQDAVLREKVQASFDNVVLDDEAKSSMLAALKQAEEAREQSQREQGALLPAAAAKDRTPARRRARMLRVALPLAACLVAAAIGIAAVNGQGASSEPSEEIVASSVDEQGEKTVDDTALEYESENQQESLSEEPGARPDSNGNENVAAEGGDTAAAARTEGTGEGAQGPAHAFPVIELSDGRWLTVIAGAAPNVDAALLQEAKAFSSDGSQSIACQVFEAEDGSFAVSYDGEVYYLARQLAVSE